MIVHSVSKLFKDATENVEVKSYDDSDTYVNLQEKDLLLNAKKNIRFETIKKYLKLYILLLLVLIY